MKCEVCDAILEKKTHQGPTTFAGCLSGKYKNTISEIYYCPDSDKDWHKRVEEYKKALDIIAAIDSGTRLSSFWVGVLKRSIKDVLENKDNVKSLQITEVCYEKKN